MSSQGAIKGVRHPFFLEVLWLCNTEQRIQVDSMQPAVIFYKLPVL